MPTSCTPSVSMVNEADSWNHVDDFVSRITQFTDTHGNAAGTAGCNNLRFDPSLKLRPTSSSADSPTGLEADLHIPLDEAANTTATPHLRKAVVKLPEGMAVNPSSANGLGVCTPEQFGIDADTAAPNAAKVECPDAAKIGTARVETPLLEEPLLGSVYVAKPYDNPFDSLLAIYIGLENEERGVRIKLPGKVETDPNTGQLTATFDENPQLPFSDFKLSFFGGPGAALRTPATCGSYSTDSTLTPWSAPQSGPPATYSDSYSISQGANGGACALPNSPSFEAGSVSPVAGTYSPFVVHLKREDGTQTFSTVKLSLPPGMIGRLADTPYCSDQALGEAAGKSGAAEQANPSCPAASKIGVANVGAGAGSQPYYTQGTAYLAGPYKGAPLSMAIVTPAVAGPYDLGTVVVRSALNVDPITTQVTATTDPIPQILEGIPLDIRSVALRLDKSRFTRNGTSCEPLSVNGELGSGQGSSTPLVQRFQLADCARLDFGPKLTLRLKGKTKRGGNPALTATLTAAEGEANIARASVSLPHSEFLDQAHIRTICTRVQFAAAGGHGEACPKGSIYGRARAITPLLDHPLEGPVFMRSSSHPLPDLVATLNGQVDIVLAGRIDSHKGGIRNTYDVVPDAPVSKFVLKMQGGKKGLLQNSTNICQGKHRAIVRFTGHNGAIAKSRPLVKAKCPKNKKHSRHAKRHRRDR